MEEINNVYAKFSQELWLLIDKKEQPNKIETKLFDMFWKAYRIGREAEAERNRQSQCDHEFEYTINGGICKKGCGMRSLHDSSD